MADPLAEIIADLAAEHRVLAGILDSLDPALWEKQTHATGWAIRDQAAHLAQFDEVATKAIVDPEAFAADARRRGEGPDYLEEARKRPPGEILRWWHEASERLVEAAGTLDAARRMPWFGPPMAATSFITARLMECWSHGLDVVDVAGVTREPSDRLRHVAFLGVRTRNYSYVTRGLEPNTEPVRLELVLPSGEPLVFGEAKAENRIEGTAEDFCQVVTQRRHYLDTGLAVSGAAAEEWMRYAQAFAGPPGEGRKPGQFKRE